MKKVGKSMFFVVLALIVALTGLSFFGFSASYGDTTKTYIKGAQDIRWGIDIRGGVDVTFSPPEDYDATNDEMAAAESIIKVRLVSQNITDSEVYTDYNKDRIIVRFPWKENETNFNPESAVKELGATALLTFRENRDGPVILEGKQVESATAVVDPETSQYAVSLRLNKEGAQAFSEATGRLIGQQISIWMDDTMISSPTVNSQIPNGEASITGGFNAEEAKSLADKINGGALPFKLQTENFSSISPTLGLGARDAMVTAGAIAFGLVCVFIIAYYRMPGIIACIALLGQIAGSIACVSGFLANIPSFTLTLPGIAGIILSIGMGVDANVITSERIKEELRIGKTLDGAIDSGFHRTFSAIFDGNITMVIVAAVLMGAFGPPGSIFSRLFTAIFRWFGPSATGAIYSFGYTLIVGVIFNFLMGVTASRLMLKSVSKFKPFKNPWLYGGYKQGIDLQSLPEKKKLDVVGRKKIWFTISATIIVVTVLCAAVFGLSLDIEFRGGSLVTYSFDGDLSKGDFQSTVEQALGQGVSVQEQEDVVTGKVNYVATLSSKEGVTPEKQESVTNALVAAYPQNNIEVVSTNNVDPSIGRDFFIKCMVAVAAAAFLMILYIAFRFRKIGGWSAGVFAVMALLHDVMFVFAAFVFFRIPISQNFIAVALTILGYSINATVVVYDRIRENKRLLGVKVTMDELVNTSINQSLTRSINTTISTVLALATVCVVSLVFHVESILTFSFPMLIGMVAGAYSSICIAGPLWVTWQDYKKNKAHK